MSAQRIFSLLKFCLWFGGIISVTEAESLAGISGAQHPPDGRLAEFLFFRRRRNPKLNRAHQSTWGHNCKNELKELWVLFIQVTYTTITFIATVWTIEGNKNYELLVAVIWNITPLVMGVFSIFYVRFYGATFRRTIVQFKKMFLSAESDDIVVWDTRGKMLFAVLHLCYSPRVYSVTVTKKPEYTIVYTIFLFLYEYFCGILLVYYLCLRAISNKFERAAAEIDAFSNKSLIDEIDQHENYEVLLDSGMHENGDREEEQAARRFRSQMRKMTETQLLVIEKAFFKCDIAVEKLFGILSWPLLFLTAATFTNIIFSVYNYTVAAITVSENSNLTLMMVYLSIASSSCLMLLIVHDPVEVYQDSIEKCQTSVHKFLHRYGSYVSTSTTNCVLHITGRPRPLSLAKFCSLGRSSLVSILAFILSSVFVALQFRSPASEASPTAVNTQNSVPSNRT